MEVNDLQSGLVRTVEEATNGIGPPQVPGLFYVSFVPFLQKMPNWFPGTGFRRFIEYYNPLIWKMLDLPLEIVKQEMVSQVPSLIHFCADGIL